MRKEMIALSMVGMAAAGCTASNQNTAPAPTPLETITTSAPTLEPTPVETPAITAAEINSRRAALQANLTPVSARKMQQLVTLTETKGYEHDYSDVKEKRLVKRVDGVTYTVDVTTATNAHDYSLVPKRIDIFIRKPGEAHAQLVIEEGDSMIQGPGVVAKIDGIVDNPLGYDPNNITTAAISQAVDKYGEYASDVLDLQALRDSGATAQKAYIHAVDQILG
jgi:hypothetical protein